MRWVVMLFNSLAAAVDVVNWYAVVGPSLLQPVDMDAVVSCGISEMFVSQLHPRERVERGSGLVLESHVTQ